MIEEITIENFKSLKAVTLKLQHVNLLIGPNNSGKSNFLKCVLYIREVAVVKHIPQGNDYLSTTFRKTLSNQKFSLNFYSFNVSFETDRLEQSSNSGIRFIPTYNEKITKGGVGNNAESENYQKFVDVFSTLKIYAPNPLTFVHSQAIGQTTSIASDCSNLISFLETLRDEYRENFYAIEQDLRNCIPEFKDIRFQTVASPTDDKRTYKRWGLFSKSSGIIHWADELSDGVLYFVALLCIVHQPTPPKLLLLEEPERGIHPRRIKEVMDFIFQLAEEKDVQVIMTSHNEHVLKEFAETPESVFIFDKDEEGATQVRNLLTDVIEPSNEYSRKNELEEIDFTSDIGESWFEGLMGGVPV